MVRQIESVISNRRLYYRFYHEKKEQICMEFVLLAPDGRITTQSKWSDGQKSVFYLLLNLYYQNSSVIILDKIENHLHPTYISKILSIIRQSGRQCIVSTHHPHVIFSEYVDQIYYIEKRPILSGDFLWYLLNTSEEQNQKVKNMFGGNKNVVPIMNYEEVLDGKFDIIVVANVIHEITPPPEVCKDYKRGTEEDETGRKYDYFRHGTSPSCRAVCRSV